MLDIHIKTIPHKEQRYPTLGDYWRDEDKKQQVRISDLENNDYAFLIAIHELVEWYLTEKRGIKEEDIMAFDEQFEREREQGMVHAPKEPGFDPRAPYIKEHTFATDIEKQLAKELGVGWEEYSATIATTFLKFEGSKDIKAGSA